LLKPLRKWLIETLLSVSTNYNHYDLYGRYTLNAVIHIIKLLSAQFSLKKTIVCVIINIHSATGSDILKKFDGMLFCTDLDGTLYSSDKTVSKENLDAIEYFKSEGGLFTFITGRMPIISKDICDIIKPNAPYGCANGGGIYDSCENKYLWNIALPEDVFELVREVEKQLPEMGIQLNTEKEIYFHRDNSAMKVFRKITGLPDTYCHCDMVTEPVLKIVFSYEDVNEINNLSELLNNHPKASNFDFIRSEKYLYEILPKGISKGNVLCKMAELLNIDINKTIAVGDYNNDISMLKAAGISFAVANAVPEAKNSADYITVSNDEHAIAAIVDLLDRKAIKV